MTHFIGGSSLCIGEETSSGMGEDLPFDERLSCEHCIAFIPPCDRHPLFCSRFVTRNRFALRASIPHRLAHTDSGDGARGADRRGGLRECTYTTQLNRWNLPASRSRAIQHPVSCDCSLSHLRTTKRRVGARDRRSRHDKVFFLRHIRYDRTFSGL